MGTQVKDQDLDPNGWYIRLNKWIGWKYPKDNFCPFFWLTLLGVILTPGLATFRTCIWASKKIVSLFGWLMSRLMAAGTFFLQLVPDSWVLAVNNDLTARWDDIARSREKKRVERLIRKWEGNEDFLYWLANETRSSLISDHTRSLYVTALLPTVEEKKEWERNGKIIHTWEADNDYVERFQELKKKETLKLAGIQGTIIALICVLSFVGWVTYMTSGNLLGTIWYVTQWAGIFTGIAALVVGFFAGAPLVYAYWTEVVLKKYCPTINWVSKETLPEPEDTPEAEVPSPADIDTPWEYK